MGDEPIELFWEDLDSGEVHIRDKWQFELKSEFFPKKGKKTSKYIQEFYLFIPKSLQINAKTYAKESFYLDQTNLIRYKTPEFTFEEILDPNSQRSPLIRIMSLCDKPDTPEHRTALSDELKLLANVVRSALRHDVRSLVFSLGVKNTGQPSEDFASYAMGLCRHIERLRERYALAEQRCLDNWQDSLFHRQMLYIDEFMSDSILHYLTGTLESIRLTGRSDIAAVDQAICDLLLKEKQLSHSLVNNGNQSGFTDNFEGENVLYRHSLLNKFVLDALHLSTNRFSLDQRYQHWIAGVSAAIAMTVYFSLFVWLGTVFVINSEPFILLTVVCYVLKDRIKEWLRNFSYLHASRWFPDYTTVIKSEGEQGDVGVIKESFSFIESPQLSQDLNTLRNIEFHAVLETVQRPENVLFYKRVVEMNASSTNDRRCGVNIIFRFNIHDFLRKAANPSEIHLTIDPTTRKLMSIRLPKVYHLNLIIRSRSAEEGKSPKLELKKLRIIIDKNGIKRIEQLSHTTTRS